MTIRNTGKPAFVPVTPKSQENREAIGKAWCLWLNSTLGILCFLNIRQKKLAHPHFLLNNPRTLPVPDPMHCNVKTLALLFDKIKNKPLRPFPQMHDCPVRKTIDDAVTASVPGLDQNHISEWRQAIPDEPTVNNEKEPLQLP